MKVCLKNWQLNFFLVIFIIIQDTSYCALNSVFTRPIRSISQNDPVAIAYAQAMANFPPNFHNVVDMKLNVTREIFDSLCDSSTMSPFSLLRKCISANGADINVVKNSLYQQITNHPNFSSPDLASCENLEHVKILLRVWVA
jgi:hypothetical protein